eukprot:scaffold12042_cov61-Phaeocystis_antarctica.AAC.3
MSFQPGLSARIASCHRKLNMSFGKPSSRQLWCTSIGICPAAGTRPAEPPPTAAALRACGAAVAVASATTSATALGAGGARGWLSIAACSLAWRQSCRYTSSAIETATATQRSHRRRRRRCRTTIGPNDTVTEWCAAALEDAAGAMARWELPKGTRRAPALAAESLTGNGEQRSERHNRCSTFTRSLESDAPCW